MLLQGITIGRDYQKGLISATYTAAQEFGSGNAVTLTAGLTRVYVLHLVPFSGLNCRVPASCGRNDCEDPTQL